MTPFGCGTYRLVYGRYIQFEPSIRRFLSWFAPAAGVSHWGADLLDIEVLKDQQANARLHEKLAELFLTRSALEWETLARDVGAVLAVVRTSVEWLHNEHARMLGALAGINDAGPGD